MQTDHVQVAVLPALDQVVPHLQRRAVPVVVPGRMRDRRDRIDPPELGGDRPIRRDHAELVVTRTRVVQRVPVGIRRGGALRQVAGLEGRQLRGARSGVEEVIAVVVRALADLHPTLPRHDVRLSGPPGAAPLLLRSGLRLGGHRAHLRPVGRIDPPHHGRGGHRPLPVVAAAGVPAEGGQSGERGVDRCGRRDGPARPREPGLARGREAARCMDHREDTDDHRQHRQPDREGAR